MKCPRWLPPRDECAGRLLTSPPWKKASWHVGKVGLIWRTGKAGSLSHPLSPRLPVSPWSPRSSPSGGGPFWGEHLIHPLAYTPPHTGLHFGAQFYKFPQDCCCASSVPLFTQVSYCPSNRSWIHVSCSTPLTKICMFLQQRNRVLKYLCTPSRLKRI